MLAKNQQIMTVAAPPDRELVTLRKLAEEMAVARRETLTTAHLLAAIAFRVSPAAELLRERKLDADTLGRMARASTETERDPIGNATRRAQDVARSYKAPEPLAIHLLIAMLSQRKSGAFKALGDAGIDVARLRNAAIQHAAGMIEPRRVATHEVRQSSSAVATAPAQRSPSRIHHAAVVVPLFPPPPPSRRPAPAVPQEPEAAIEAPAPAPQARPAEPPTVAAPMPASADEDTAPKRTAPRRKTPRGASTPHVGPRDASRWVLDPRSFPALCAIGTNLTLAAARGELEPTVEREVEIDRALDVLAKRRANNPCLIGPLGVGRSSVVRGLAARIAAARDVRSLDDRIIVELPVAKVAAAVRSGMGDRFTTLVKEVREAAGRVVVVLDDIHQLLAGDGAIELGGEFRIALANGEVPVIATATPEEYRRAIESDPSLASCFSPIDIEEPSRDRAVSMIEASSTSLAHHHDLEIGRDAIDAAVAWSIRYLPGRALPDKALSVLDLACARARRRGRTALATESVAEVIAEIADMPVERLLETDGERMLSLAKLLGERVVGHDAALERIAHILRRNAAGLRGRRPIGSFLLLGPTGVGKTETAKAIAEALFHSADAMTRLDLSEFAEPHALARLIGAPPGYVGHEAGGQLTEAVRRRPYQVILLDEIEKAHRDVLEAFLQVLDEGRMTDGRGRTVDLTNTVIVMTSNLGSAEAAEAARARSIGFSNRGSSSKARDVEDAVVQAARDALPPELYNRIDEVIPFAPLTRADVREVARRLLAALSRQLQKAKGIAVEFDDDAIESLLDQGGYDPSLGARPMRRAIARLVEAPIAELVLRGLVERGVIRLGRGRDGSLEIQAERGPAN